jgi:anaerobic selenocysteine-containing dehydrogenase
MRAWFFVLILIAAASVKADNGKSISQDSSGTEGVGVTCVSCGVWVGCGVGVGVTKGKTAEVVIEKAQYVGALGTVVQLM